MKVNGKKGIREGYAKEFLPYGNWYEEEIKNDAYGGYGIYYFRNGDKFEGGWNDGYPNGLGIFYSSFGFQIEWYFKRTKLELILIIIHKIFLFLNDLYSKFLETK